MSKRRKIVYKNRRKRKFYFSVLLVCLFMIGLGYSNLVSHLNINGTVSIWKYDKTLYGVLERAATIGTYAAKYTGEHQDSMAGDGDKEIYHWYATNDTNGAAILDKNNVIFAGYCWQMIRTTDTGGVKMIYNGKAVNNQCLNTRSSQIGYGFRSSQNLASNYYYGTTYEHDSSTNKFSLSGAITQETWNATTGPTLVGKYTCMQTTDTGACGTLYLVESYNNTSSGYVIPISSSYYFQFGTLEYNTNFISLSSVGYMYNATYPATSSTYGFTVTSSSAWTINTGYYYSDMIDWNTMNANKYTLINPVLISTLSGDYSSLVGKYVLNTSGTNYTTARYITAVDSNRVYYKELSGGNLNTSLTIGDSYTESGGVYTLTGNVTNVPYETWYSTSDFSIYKGKYVCDGNNTNCTNLKHIYAGSNPTKNSYYYIDSTTAFTFAKSVSYDGTTYTLTGGVQTFWDFFDSTNQEYLSTHHYTCLGNGSNCTTVGYVICINYGIYYVQLSGVEDIETALNNMLYTSNVNTKNSSIKAGIDAWYEKYLTPYNSYLEDTIFCNNRTIKSLGAWKSDGGIVTDNYELQFQEYTATKDLSCDRVTDQFSTLNTSAKLTYKVGLMSSSEMNLLNNDSVRATRDNYWLISPNRFSNIYPSVNHVNHVGFIQGKSGSSGVRPAVSLAPGTTYTSGNGSMANPYIVDAIPSTLSLNESSLKMRGVGSSSTLVATTNMEGTITWESSNPSVATVDSNGLVTAVSVGTTIVTARVGLMSASTAVKVLTALEYDSWETIVENAQNNNTNDYHVGDIKTVTLGNNLGTHTLRVVNNSTPTECSTIGFSQTACGFVLEFADVIAVSKMNSVNTTAGGWPASIIRTYLNDENEPTSIINSLPEIIRDAIIDTTVVSGHGYNETNFVSTDKLYLLSAHEVWEDVDGYPSAGVDYLDAAYPNTRQLDYYAGISVTSSNYAGAIKKKIATNSNWWLRTAYSTSSNYFLEVGSSGFWSYEYASYIRGVSPAFRLSGPVTPAPESFATDSWETIVTAVRSNNTSVYQVGDTKEVDMGELGTHTLRIANKSTPSECSTTGFSQTACGFVLEFADIVTTHRMNLYTTWDSNLDGSKVNGTGNKGGWEYSDMRAYLNSTTYANENIDYSTTGIYSSLPEELRNAIINTTVVSGHGSVDTTNYTTTDKLYLLSTHEVWEDVDGNMSSGIDYYDTAYNNTRQLDYYAGLGVTTSSYSGAIKRRNDSNSSWWLRSAYSTSTSPFNYVVSTGVWSNNFANGTNGVSPAFRIG